MQRVRAEPKWRQIHATMHEHYRPGQVWIDAEYPVPETWYLMTGGSTTALRSLQLRMPNSRSVWSSLTFMVYSH